MEHLYPSRWRVDAVDEHSLLLLGGDAQRTIIALIDLQRHAIMRIGEKKFSFVRVTAGGPDSVPTVDTTLETDGDRLRVRHGAREEPEYPVRSTIREIFVERRDDEILGLEVTFAVTLRRTVTRLKRPCLMVCVKC